MSTKLFTFNASSFTLEANVENLLRSRGAITLDFGSSAYIDSDRMSQILSDLVEKSASATSEELVTHLKEEIIRIDAQRQKMVEEDMKVVQELKSASTEIATLRGQLESAYKTIQLLRSQSERPQPNSSSTSTAFDQTQYERTLKELREIKAHNAETITSLKVLEDENDELRKELDALKAQAKTATASKTS